MSAEQTIDLSNPREKGMLISRIRECEGLHRVTIVKWRPRRSTRQNSFYWPCFVQPFADYLREQGEGITDDEAHEMLKLKFLRRPVVNPETGEVIGQTTRSTTTLNTGEFNLYLDQCAAWLFDMFHFKFPDPKEYHEK